ncbi:MAG: insulinase family protein [Candidatus Eisenbacteria bacterium]|nr:insulinase family protein [Candidatus Eisenbacteria bacterium]
MNRLCFPALACAVLLSLSPAPSHAGAGPSVTTLRNGLRVVLAPDSLATAVDVSVWYPAGTRWEPKGMAGVSSLVSRLMYRGSAHFPDGEHVRLLGAEGATLGNSNTPDAASYSQTIPAGALTLALRLEADRMRGLAVSAKAFDASRAQALADRRLRAEATPMARGLSRLVATAFGDGAYGRSPWGEADDLRRLTPATVEAWRRSHYGAGGAVLTITGLFEPAGTLASVRTLFEAIPRGAASPFAPVPLPPAGERRAWTAGQTPLRLAFAGWRGPGSGDADAPAFELLAAALGADSSRYRSALESEWKVAVATECGLQSYRDASLLWVAAALDAGADSSAAERVMLDEVGRLAREPLPAEPFTRLRSRLVLDALFGSQAVRARAAAIGEAVFEHDDPALVGRRIEALENLTPEDVQRVARKWLLDSGRSVSWYVPAGEGR